MLRVGFVALFYALQLVHYSCFAERNDADILFQRQVTWLAAGYLCVSLGVLVALRQRFFPDALKFVTCGFDVCLLTVAAAIGAGPDSPLMVGYFVIIAMAALRFSLPVIWMATLGSMAGYLLLVGRVDSTWFDAEHTTPVIQQLLMFAGLGATGVAVGQVVRMMRQASQRFGESLERLKQLQALQPYSSEANASAANEAGGPA